MAKLKAAQRAGLRSSQFALPGERKYPVHDYSHAVNAKARATQQYKRGNLSASQYKAIFAKANRVIHAGGPGRGARAI